MDAITNNTGRTLVSVLYGKLVDYVEDRTMKQMTRDLFLSVTTGFVVGMAAFPGLTLSLLRWRDGVLPSCVFILLVAVHGKALAISLWNLGVALVPEATETAEDRIEGIPTVELLDHLFTEKSFRRDDVKSKFLVPQYRVEELGRRLQDLGVLMVGPNNLKVLNPAYSRQDVAAILKGKASADFQSAEVHAFTSDGAADRAKHVLGRREVISCQQHVREANGATTIDLP